MTRARRVLDIGMFTGYSALAMAEALPDDGVVVACEVDPTSPRFAQECFAPRDAGGRIDVRVGPAADDARSAATAGSTSSSSTPTRPATAATWTPCSSADLLAPGGSICVDNTLMQGQPWRGERTANGAAIAAFNTRSPPTRASSRCCCRCATG